VPSCGFLNYQLTIINYQVVSLKRRYERRIAPLVFRDDKLLSVKDSWVSFLEKQEKPSMKVMNGFPCF